MNPQAGWYQEPGRPLGHLRYWDGQRWTEHRVSRPVMAPPSGGSTPGAPGAWATGVTVLVSVAACLLVLVAMVAVLGGRAESDSPDVAAAESEPTPTGRDAPRRKADRSERKKGQHAKGSLTASKPSKSAKPTKLPRPAKTPQPQKPKRPPPAPKPPTTYLVTRVVDGDTLELGNGETVRLVGIDTPEVGECGYERAKETLVRLVLDHRVRLSVSDEDRDGYGRLLRYVNIGTMDAGLRLIKNGLAIARYDSRDGYGFHPREPFYIAADNASRNVACPPKPKTFVQAPPSAGGNCAPGYSPCVPPYPPDLDCANVDGPIFVTGSDPHGLDSDGDGIACESG